MLSRVLDKTKRLLTRSPSLQGESEAPVSRNRDLSAEMVTSTRRGPIDQTPQSTPRSSTRKTKRPLEAEDTPLATKKRRGSKKTGLQEVTLQGTAAEGTDQDAVPDVSTTEIRGTQQTDEQGENTTTPARPSSPKVVIQKTVSPAPADEEAPASAADDNERVMEESDIQNALAKQFLPTPKLPRPAEVSAIQSGKKRGRKCKGSESNVGEEHEDLPAPAVEESAPKRDAVTEVADSEADDEEPIQPVESSIPSRPKNIRIRFDSEEPPAAHSTEEEPPIPKPAPTQTDDDSESDDEAPEEITASTALAAARQAETAAIKASKAQQQAQEAKRKARADRIALEQRQKRERLEEEALQREKQEARKAKKLAKRAKVEEGLDGYEQENKLGIDLSNLPTLLPTSLLDAAGDVRPPTPPRLSPGVDPIQQRREKLARHIKFLERGEKRVKDVKRGGVNVRVLEEQNELLASKVNQDTKNVRESWLKGRREGKGKGKGTSGKGANGKMRFQRMERKAVGGGFLRSGD